jgi:Na+-driven multidrug efflux pump
MPVYFFGIIIFGIQMSCQSTFLALGQAKVSLFIALLRKVVLLIPLAVILPKFMGVAGIYRAEPVADILSVTVTSILFIHTARRLFRKE